jgi:hypothetical protein
VYCNEHLRGRLFLVSASLLFSIASEILKWQFPVNAAAEKFTILSSAFRSLFSSALSEPAPH